MNLANLKIINREEKCSKHMNVIGHYDDTTLVDKNGKLIKIIKLSGLDFITKDESLLAIYKNRRNNLLKNFSSEFAFYFWDVRTRVKDYPAGEFHNSFAGSVDEKYKQRIEQTELYSNELYIAIITKQAEGLINKGFSVLKHLSSKFDKQAKQNYLLKRFHELNDVTDKVISALSDYHCELLGTYQKNGRKYSAALSFLAQFINLDHSSVPLVISHAGRYMAKHRLFFNNRSGTIEIRAGNGKSKFAAILSIKAYQSDTYPGILDELSLLKIEYVITQSYRFYDRQIAKGKLRDQQKDMLQSKEESLRLTEQIDDAFDDTASGELGYGAHHFSIMCYADNQEELNKHVGTLIAQFSDLDIVAVREDVGCECTFWAQLPGNFGYVVRKGDISTKNIAAFASLHNYPKGKLFNNHWGPAVSVFETISGSPYYFNFHYKDVGNFLVCGAMGSGKTVLIGFLILQSMRFGGKRIIFDKDRGLEILVRAMAGVYEIIKPGIATGFNPCQLADTPENRKFLNLLFRKMLTVTGGELTEHDNEVIDHAIQGIYRLSQSERQLCHIASFFGTKKKSSLRARFDEWHSDGAHAWLFDNANDTLNLNSDVLGFDLGHILNDEECKTPALMYLLYRVEKAIEGHRGLLFCDEGWRALNDDYFKTMINDWARTPRKKDNIFGLATQVANDTVDSSISKAINESAFCKIFFPNPSADKKVYTDDFGLSEKEYELIKTMPDDQHYFLLNHGRSTNKQSVILRLNLQGMEEIISVISAREHTLQLLDAIRLEVGNDPDNWLPVFFKRLKGGQ